MPVTSEKNAGKDSVNYWVVVPAAGSGRRFSASLLKQYALLRDKPVLSHTLNHLLAVPQLSTLVLVHGADDVRWQSLPEIQHEKMLVVVGGDERVDSVRNGLLALSGRAQANDWVLVHDAARPCCFTEDITALINALVDHPVGGLLAVPVTDTVKRANSQHEVTQTVDRSTLWRAQTPQMFRYGMLLDALNQAQGLTITDEAQAIERLGLQPLLVKGNAANIKITHQDDLPLAEFYLLQRERARCE